MIILILLRIILGKIMYLKHWRSYLKQDSILYPLLSKTLTNIYCDFFHKLDNKDDMFILFLFACLSLVSPISEKDNIDTILFIGHAYGKPGLDNKAIDPSVIKFINNYSTDKYSYIVWGGDFINECNSAEEVSNFQFLPESVIQKSLLSGEIMNLNVMMMKISSF